MHVHCLHDWLMSTGLLFQSTLCLPCKSQFVQLCQWRALMIWQWAPDIATTVSTHLPRPCSGYWPIMGTCGWLIHSNSAICVVLLLCLSLWNHLITLMLFPTNSLYPLTQYHCIPWNESSKTGKNQPFSVCQVSCTRWPSYCSAKWLRPLLKWC